MPVSCTAPKLDCNFDFADFKGGGVVGGTVFPSGNNAITAQWMYLFVRFLLVFRPSFRILSLLLYRFLLCFFDAWNCTGFRVDRQPV